MVRNGKLDGFVPSIVIVDVVRMLHGFTLLASLVVLQRAEHSLIKNYKK